MMRRIILSLTMMAVALIMAASVALAITKTCPVSGLCGGTSSSDTLYGSDAKNLIYAFGGSDSVYAYGGPDLISGEGGADTMRGGPGDDALDGGDGPDILVAGTEKDELNDSSLSSNDTYRGFLAGASFDRDVVLDHGGNSDVLSLTNVSSGQVFMAGVDTLADADTKKDSLLIEENGTTNSVLLRDYFNNSGGDSPGTGVIETIRFSDKTAGFPAGV